MRELRDGVYKHNGDGRFYQVLFVAKLCCDVKKDQSLFVGVSYLCREEETLLPPHEIFVTDEPEGGRGVVSLFMVRAHADYKKDTEVAVYVPLYTDKPGRRVSVRDALDFFDAITDKTRVERQKFWFTGHTIPQT